MKKQKCPYCGGTIVASNDKDIITCEYCGSVLPSYDKSIEHRREYVDAARIRESDNLTRIKEKELEIESQQNKWNREDRKEAQAHRRNIKRVGLVFGTAAVLVVVLFSFVYGLVDRLFHIGDVRMPCAASAFINMDYNEAHQKLSSLGFREIIEVERADLRMSEQENSEKVSEITIDGSNSFRKRAWFDKNAKVVLTYSVIDPERENDVQVPGTSDSLSGENYEIIKHRFSGAGFTNISFAATQDVKLFTKEFASGDVYEVLIDGRNDYSDGAYFSKDVKVVICLHADKGLAKKINLREMPYNTSDFKGIDYDIAKTRLEEKGFSNVQAEASKDLDSSSDEKNGQIKSIKINGKAIKKGNFYSPDDVIIIAYYSVKDNVLKEEKQHEAKRQGKIEIPKKSSKYIGKNFEVVRSELEQLGFTDITVNEICDLKSFNVLRDRKVCTLSIGGKEQFDAGELFEPDAKVVITYRTK